MCREAAQLAHELLEGEYIDIQVSDEHHDTVDDLRDQRHHQDHKEQDHGQDSQQDRQRVPQLFLLDSVQHVFGVHVDQGRHHIGDHQGHEDRRADLPDPCQQMPQDVQMRQHHIQHDRRAQRHCISNPFFF